MKKKPQGILLSIFSLLLLFFVSCNLGLGNGGGGGSNGSSSDDEEINGEQEYRALVESEVTMLPADPTPEQVYEAGATLRDALSTHEVSSETAVSIIEELVEDAEIEVLLRKILKGEYSLQDVQSEMNGVSSNPDEGVEASLSLDQNIDDDSTVQLNGDVEWDTGVSGSGLRFDEEGEYVSVPDSDSVDLLGDEASIEVWIYPENNITAAGIVHKGVKEDFSDESYSLQYNSPGEVAIIFTNTSGTHTYVISNEEHLQENQWHHIVISWNQSEVRMYIDGQQVTNLKYFQNEWKSSLPPDFAPIRDSDGALMIGSQPVPGYRFEGIIDNVTLYNRILSAAEVSEHYNQFAN
jgi:hypothetical protein